MDDMRISKSSIGLSERQVLSLLSKTGRRFFNYLSLPAREVPPKEAYAAVLTRKNLLLQMLAERRQHWNVPDGAEQTDKIGRLKEQRKKLIQERANLAREDTGPSQTGNRKRQIKEIEEKIGWVEDELAVLSGAYEVMWNSKKAMDSDAICRSLLATSVAILDYVGYARRTPTQEGRPRFFEGSYAVFVVRGGHCPDVQRFELGSAETIQEAIEALRRELALGGETSETRLRSHAQALGRRILPPAVMQSLSGIETILIAPDGPLALVPFKLLIPDGSEHFLMEQFLVSTVPSGRDAFAIMAERGRPGGGTSPSSSEKGVLLVGNPDYGAMVEKAGADAYRSSPRAGCESEIVSTVDPLPNTAIEVATIAEHARHAFSVSSVEMVDGRQATEAGLTTKISGQRYVHLATHGFFTEESCMRSSSVQGRGVQVALKDSYDETTEAVQANPLLLAGVALAGFNRRSQASSGVDDGVLTALEVTRLDLHGTELVVLSACDTGLGAIHLGQELMGLRWAFNEAGAKSLVTSLWKVPDEPTVRLMTKFYSYLWRSPKDGGPLGKAAALQQAQRDLMNENRAKFSGDSRPSDWGAWVLSGDWR
jgi:CHAT domain-containing protein